MLSWEIPRLDVAVDVRFYGKSERIDNGRAIWTAGQEVLAVAYDVPVPGCASYVSSNHTSR
jgi:starch phosphorylase